MVRSFGIPLLLSLLVASSAAAAGRRVVFVDNAAPPNGSGTQQSPLRTLSDAVQYAGANDVIYVAEGNAPYQGNVTLKQGQMLIGAAYGLEAAAMEFHTGIDASAPAVQGPGPTIDGTVMLAGDNVVAGVTFANEAGAAVATHAPTGTIAIRKTYFRPSKLATALLLDGCTAPVTVTGGGITAAAPASGLVISGGTAPMTFERFAISGTFSSAVTIINHNTGILRFVDGSKIAVDDAKMALTITNSRGRILFTDPITITTHDGRGIVASSAGPLLFTGGNSHITTVNGAALDLRDVRFSGTFDSISSDSARDGIFIDKLTGKLAVTGDGKPGSGGAIRRGGITITQSGGIELASIDVDGALFLRHVSASKFRDLAVSNGVTADNVRDDVFDALRVTGGDVQLREPGGSIAFSRCAFTNTAVDVQQQFNDGKVSFDHCDLAAPTLAGERPPLLRAHTSGGSKLSLEMNGVQLHHNTGSIISIDAAGTSSMRLSVLQSFGEKFAGRFIEATSHDQAKLAVSVQQTRVAVPGISGAPLITVDGAADTCIDMRDDALTFGGGAPAIRVRTSGPLSVVGAKPADAQIDAPSVVTVASCGE